MVTRAEVLAAEEAHRQRQSASPRSGPTREQVLAAEAASVSTPRTDAEREAVGQGAARRQLARSAPLGVITQPLSDAIADPETRDAIGRNIGGAARMVGEIPNLDAGRLLSDTASRGGQAWNNFWADPGAAIMRVIQGTPEALAEATVRPYERFEAASRDQDLARARGDTEATRAAAERRAGATGGVATNIAGGALAPLGGARFIPQAALAAALTAPHALANAPGDTLQERLPEAIVHTGEAGLLGGTLARGVPIAASGTSRLLSPLLKMVKPAASEATERLAQNLGYEPPAQLTPDQLEHGRRVGTEAVAELARRKDPTGDRLSANPMEQRGKPITAAEALGREAETQLKVTGRRSGETPDTLEAAMNERISEMPNRIVQDFEEITGLRAAEVEGDFAAQAARLREAARPLYQAAEAFDGPVVSDELTALARTSSVQRALRNALDIASDERVAPDSVGLFVTPQGSIEVRNPTVRTWDLIKRGLDDVLETYRDRTTRRLNLDERGRATLGVLNQVRDALTDERQPWGPAYRAALDAGGEPIRLEGAFRDASKLMGNSVRMSQFDTRVASMGPAEREALRAGIVNEIQQRAMSGRGNRLADLRTRLFETKLVRLFGDEQGRAIIQRIEDEKFLLTHGRRMQPGIGSDTSEVMLANAEQERALRQVSHMARLWAAGKPIEAITAPILDSFMGFVRGAQVPLDRAARDTVGRLLMLPPSELAAALQAHASQKGLALSEAQAMTAITRAQAALGANTGREVPETEPMQSFRSRALNQAIAPSPQP